MRTEGNDKKIALETIGIFGVHPGQRQRFISGELWRQWARAYPAIFDDDDQHLAETQAPLGYHFYEWLAAILLYNCIGYLSLVEQYEFKTHKRKREILQRLASPQLLEFICDRAGHDNIQCPDLLVYAPDYSDWFFCEVKGPGDRIREQQARYFQSLADISGKRVRLVLLRKSKSSEQAG